MSWADVLDVVDAAALTVGACFAAYQLTDLRHQRRREGVLALIRSYQSADFTSALRQVNSLPDGADRATIRERLGPTGENQVFLVGLTWESLGVLVFRREVDMQTMDDFFSGAIVVSWRKLSTFVEQDRAGLHRDTVWEWFQWLADRTRERESANAPIPAHIAHSDWRPSRRA